jgi:hypothetical protein
MIHKTIKYDNQDQQGKAAFNERNPIRPSNKNLWQGAQATPPLPPSQNKSRTGHKAELITKMINNL